MLTQTLTEPAAQTSETSSAPVRQSISGPAISGPAISGPAIDTRPKVLEVTDLVKSYDQHRVLNGVSLDVRQGEIFGFLGPNGAGKTTTLEIIEGLRDYDSGNIRVLGMDHQKDIRRIRSRLGVSLQATKYWGLLTVTETLRLFQSIYPRSLPVADLVQMFELEDIRYAAMKALSGGQYQRVVLALALVNDPDLILLDEPTVGLDPRARARLWEVIRGLKARGKTVILTTHYMDEAEALSDRVAIIHQGRIVDCGPPKALIRSLGKGIAISFTVAGSVDAVDLASRPGCISARAAETPQIADQPATDQPTIDGRAAGRWTVQCHDLELGLTSLLEWARQQGVRLQELETRMSTQDDVFLRFADQDPKKEL